MASERRSCGYRAARAGKSAAEVARATTQAAPQAAKLADDCGQAGSIALRTGEAGKTTVYLSRDASGNIQYVGITDDIARRSSQHARRFVIARINDLPTLSRDMARAVEQAIIESFGMGKNGGSLQNKINSIARDNPLYEAVMDRGRELAKLLGLE